MLGLLKRSVYMGNILQQAFNKLRLTLLKRVSPGFIGLISILKVRDLKTSSE